jgi:proteasome lid subunit RPN8/RPN11
MPFRLEYAPEALEQIRRIAVEAYYAMPRGGMEVGGLLLGRYRNGGVEVLNSVPAECEHAKGPGFVLSPADHAKWKTLVSGRGHQPDGEELQAVGWYHSHTRSGIFLSKDDLDIHSRYFPERWQVALVVRPEHGAPARAGFFFRDAAGILDGEATALEFRLRTLPHGAPAPTWGAPAAVARAAPAVLPELPPPPEAPPRAVPPAPVMVPPSPSRSSWVAWVALAMGLAALVSFAGFAFRDTEVKVLREDLKRERMRARELERRLDIERKANEVRLAPPPVEAPPRGTSQ